MKQCDQCSRKFPDHMVFCPFDGDILDAEVEDPLLGRVIDGKYRLEEKLGEGGMGTVYRAKHVLIQNDLAIKVLHSTLVADRHAVARFQREATAAARIKHPNAVGVSDFGRTDDEIVYIVMELFVGKSLRDIIEQEGVLPIDRSITMIRQVCLALDAAHRSGVIHRDIKPDNIVIDDKSEQGEIVKVLDFGIAKLKDGPSGESGGRLTRQGVIIGSPHYLSPEQCQNSELDARSDIYSLGIVLYEMFTADVPFKAPTPIAVAMMHTTEKPTPIREKRPDVPEPIEHVVMRALEKNPANRPQSALELAQELERASLESGIPVLPLPGATSPFTLLNDNNSQEFNTKQMAAVRAAATRSNPKVPNVTPEPTNLPTNTPLGTNNTKNEAPGLPKFVTTSSLSPEESSKKSGRFLETPSFISNVPSNPPPNVSVASLGSASTTLFNMQAVKPPSPLRFVIPLAATLVLLIGAGIFGYFQLFKTTPAVTNNGTTVSDPGAAAPPGMAYVKAGSFKMGHNISNDQPDKSEKFSNPEHEISVAAFYLDKTEVTNQEYKKFVDETKHAPPQSWKDGQFVPGTDLEPVTKVSWADADAYAKWAGKRLPTEAEWEYAARGTDGRAYPWGDAWQEGLAVSKEIDNAPHTVGSLPKGASPFGILDMAGNVWEWTADTFKPYPGNDDPVDDALKNLKVIRGGSFKSDKSALSSYVRNLVPADFKDSSLGFRCAKSAP